MTMPGVGGTTDSPWSRPSGAPGEPVVTWVSPATGVPIPASTRPGGAAIGAPGRPTYPGYPQPPAPPEPPKRAGIVPWAVGGGVVLVLGLVVVLVLAATGVFRSGGQSPLLGPFGGEDPEASKPPLAQLCPPASENPPPGGKEPVPVEGPRIADRDSGISYLRLDSPWLLWDRGSWGQGTLGVEYNTGYYFVTESYSAGDYLASVLSGKVPATVGDSLSLNLPCAGRQVAEDVRRAYYPQPNVKEQARDEQVVVGGRPAWVSTFHLTFQASGLEARGEQVAVVLIDVGRPDAAVLYISIPDTHRQYNPQIDQIIASIQPA